MPTYEYVCTNCRNEWEEVQRISEPPVQKCPKCKKNTASRQISAGNFILKGGGWYADSYSSPKDKKKDDSAKTESKDASTTTEAKPDVKKSDGKTETPAKKESAPATKTSGETSGSKS